MKTSSTGLLVHESSRLAAILGALCVAITSAALWVDSYTWRGWLPAALSAMTRTDLIAAPFAATVGAWLGGRGRHHGLRRWSAAMPRTAGSQFEPELGFMGRVVTVHIVLLLGFVGGVCLVSAAARPPESIWLVTIPIVCAASMMAWSVAGILIGKLAPTWLAALLSLSTPYGVSVAIIWFAPGTFLEALTAYSGRFYVEAIPHPAGLLVRAVFWTSLAIFIGALFAWRRTARRASGLLCWLALSLTVLGGGLTEVPIKGATEAVCTTSALRVCVDRAHGAALATYAASASDLYARIPTRLRPIGFQPASLQRGNVYLGRVVGVGPVRGSWDATFDIDREQFAARVGNALFLRSCEFDSPQAGQTTEHHAINLWWRRLNGLRDDVALYPGDVGQMPDEDRATIQSLSHSLDVLDDAGQDLWITTNASDLLGC